MSSVNNFYEKLIFLIFSIFFYGGFITINKNYFLPYPCLNPFLKYPLKKLPFDQ